MDVGEGGAVWNGVLSEGAAMGVSDCAVLNRCGLLPLCLRLLIGVPSGGFLGFDQYSVSVNQSLLVPLLCNDVLDLIGIEICLMVDLVFDFDFHDLFLRLPILTDCGLIG